MNRQNGIASLTLVLLLLVLGTLILTGLNQQLITFTMLVGDESRAIQQQAAAQSALEWGRVQHWSLQPDVQCKQRQTQRVCLRVLNESQVTHRWRWRAVALAWRGDCQRAHTLFTSWLE